MDKLTDGSYHSRMTDEQLAYWLVEDAKKVDGKPGMTNVASALRQAAFRLCPNAAPWLAEEEKE